MFPEKSPSYSTIEDHEMTKMPQDDTPDPDSYHLLPSSIGDPSAKVLISWLDCDSILVAVLALTVAIAVVWNHSAANHLGQTNQLVVVGFALTVMSLCAQRQILLAAVSVEAWRGSSTLANYDALLKKSVFSQELSVVPRFVLLILIVLPLALSVVYKKFSGGSSTVSESFGNSKWGYISRPGWPWSGNGISGAVDAYVPFWNDVGMNRTYGYNLYVASNTTAAILDTPQSDDTQSIRASLRLGEFVIINTATNATVAEYNEIPTSERGDSLFWGALGEKGFINHTIPMDFGLFSQITAPLENSTEIFLSIWDVTNNETFESTAQRFIQTRRHCMGTWNISASNISLIKAELLETSDDQIIIQQTVLNLGDWFTELLAEYNYRWYPPVNLQNTQINTFPPLVGSIVWARLVSHNGYQNVNKDDQIRSHTARTLYEKPASDVHMERTSVTLKRSGWLLFVLAITPALTILAVLIKALLYSVPVSDEFGLISLLSGVKQDDLAILRGAGLSGKLGGDVKVRFEVLSETGNNGVTERRVQVALERSGSAATKTIAGARKIERGVLYG